MPGRSTLHQPSSLLLVLPQDLRVEIPVRVGATSEQPLADLRSLHGTCSTMRRMCGHNDVGRHFSIEGTRDEISWVWNPTAYKAFLGNPEACVGVLDRQTYQGGTRGSRLCGEDRDRETENSKVSARTRDTRFIQVRVAKVANPASCLGNKYGALHEYTGCMPDKPPSTLESRVAIQVILKPLRVVLERPRVLLGEVFNST
jgi:hypothetical protein